MHNSYLDRVSNWIKEAPAQEWGKDYAKEAYSKAYVWVCSLILLANGVVSFSFAASCYSPRGIYKGGGQCVRRLGSSHGSSVDNALPREKYAERIINFEKTREKHKEIHPPMAFLKNKPLSCAKYFVEDVICSDNNEESTSDRPDTSSAAKASRKCSAHCPPSPERRNQGCEEDDGGEQKDRAEAERRTHQDSVHTRLYYNSHGSKPTVLGGSTTPEPPTTAEYVAHPQWRQHSPQKWVGGKPFASTVLSSNAHTASRRSISGSPYAPTLLVNEPFASAGAISSPASPQVREHEHERRVKMAAEATYRPIQRPEKKYFNSMWAESPAAAVTAASSSAGNTETASIAPSESTTANRASSAMAPLSPLSSPVARGNGGRELLQSIREQHQKKSSPGHRH
ncbi:hypothetical protein BBJ28_00021349 [Nothophytophthora sp. Chile5]|nr:hypothetical protein BBJ28_00021349 [Nothophytophthora sp. Chile5]